MPKSHSAPNPGRPGLIRTVLGGLCVFVLIGGAVLTWGQAPSETVSEQAVSDTDTSQVIANLVAPPAPGSFAVAEDDVAPLLIADATSAAPTPDCVARLDQMLSPVILSFDRGSASIGTQNANLLNRISDEIIGCEEAYVMVAGHADGSGEDDINLALSWERADRTLNILLSLGVDPSSIEAVGFGARAPLAQGSDDGEDAADRRVDFRVLRRP